MKTDLNSGERGEIKYVLVIEKRRISLGQTTDIAYNFPVKFFLKFG